MTPSAHTLLPLPGLDGSNPLAFFAALGALRLLDQAFPDQCRLGWTFDGIWMPVLDVPAPVLDAPADVADRSPLQGALLATLARLVAARQTDPIFGLRWDEKNEKGVTKEKRNLRSPPDVWRRWVASIRPHSDRLSIDFAAASASEVEMDDNGKYRPTVFEFTAGQQMFLATTESLHQVVTIADLDEAVFGPWKKTRKVNLLNWDATDSRDYALRARNPSGDTKTGVPGADVLAVWGLSFFPVMPTARDNRTTATGGAWKSEWFRWGLWTTPLAVDPLRSVVALCGGDPLSPASAKARGIAIQFASSIGRSEQGGYGSFAPPRLVG